MGVVAANARAWGGALSTLLPSGPAWPRDPESTLMKLIGALAQEPARADARLSALIDEADPDTAFELLADWERVAGLPDACQSVAGSIRERQRAVVQRLTATGGQSIAYYTAIAASMGITIWIEEHRAMTCDDDCEDACTDDAWATAWTIHVTDADDITDFYDVWATADSACEEPIRAFGSGQLECRILGAAPAHTDALFSYDTTPEPLLWFNFTDPQEA